MEEFKVATFNVKDKGPWPFESGKDNQKRAETLANYLLTENLAAMGAQEVTKRYSSTCQLIYHQITL